MNCAYTFYIRIHKAGLLTLQDPLQTDYACWIAAHSGLVDAAQPGGSSCRIF